jgi:hypothetical protein
MIALVCNKLLANFDLMNPSLLAIVAIGQDNIAAKHRRQNTQKGTLSTRPPDIISRSNNYLFLLTTSKREYQGLTIMPLMSLR